MTSKNFCRLYTFHFLPFTSVVRVLHEVYQTGGDWHTAILNGISRCCSYDYFGMVDTLLFSMQNFALERKNYRQKMFKKNYRNLILFLSFFLIQNEFFRTS